MRFSATVRGAGGSSDHGQVPDGQLPIGVVPGADVERLRRRVADLEVSVGEYRAQLGKVLNSRSWRVTAPLRDLASRARMARARANRVGRTPTSVEVNLVGLFPPDPARLPATSPLRHGVGRPKHEASASAHSSPQRAAPILVVAHVHHPELWEDIQDRLSRIPMAFDLHVTVTQGVAQSAVPVILARFPLALVEVVPNRGRDWAPLLELAQRGALAGYTAVVKVHTKKSEHRADGHGWRLDLLDGVLESPAAINAIVSLLTRDPTVGLVVPTGNVGTKADWGSNLATVELLASRLPMAFDPELLTFPAGSMFWSRPWLLERLADLGLGTEDFEVEGGQLDATTAHALERMVGVCATVAGMDVVAACDVRSRLGAAPRAGAKPEVLAFFLPQYHVSPVNDRFWGAGYTDWQRVLGAKPQFPGHRQPLEPAVCYDLSEPGELHRQARLLEHSGVNALVFHYYWFGGTKVLDTPLGNLLADPDVEMPFALCWANEPWTRRWDGLEHDVLLDQTFPAAWQEAFYRDIRQALHDRRYFRVNGCPLLVIYRLDLIPDLAATVATWRAMAVADGLAGLHLLGVLPSRDFGELPVGAAEVLDGLVSFPPGSAVRLSTILPDIPGPVRKTGGDIFSYDVAATSPLPQSEDLGVPVHPCVFPGWDNTARRGGGSFVFHGANQFAFRRWLYRACQANPRSDPRLVFINAWNEWAEGAAIEGTRLPDVFPGSTGSGTAAEIPEPSRPFSQWLGQRPTVVTRRPRIAALVHLHYPELWPELCAHLARLPEDFDLWLSLTSRAAHLAGQAQAGFPNVRVIYPDGRGRDIAPLLMLVHEGLLEPYELVVKVHGKRSPHRADGDQWRTELLSSLLPSRAGITDIVTAMRMDPTIGLCAGHGALGGPGQWGANLACARRLAARRSWNVVPGELQFPMGSMFWARSEVLRDLAGFDIRYFEFEEEQGQLDGTIAHAVERLIGVVNLEQGRQIVTASNLRTKSDSGAVRREGRG